MRPKPERDATAELETTTALRNWVIVSLAAVFVLLYGAALSGWLKPLPDERVVARLDPIIFVIIGYYFGRLPSQQNERMLKGELSRQTQRADAAQHAKEQAQQSREALEEKVKNIKVTLASPAISITSRNLSEKPSEIGETNRQEALRQSVAAALNILNS